MWSYGLDLQSIRLTVVKVFVRSERTCNNCLFVKVFNYFLKCSKEILTLSLPRSSIDDLVFSVFTSNFFKLSYKISLIKNRFVTLFFIRFS